MALSKDFEDKSGPQVIRGAKKLEKKIQRQNKVSQGPDSGIYALLQQADYTPVEHPQGTRFNGAGGFFGYCHGIRASGFYGTVSQPRCGKSEKGGIPNFTGPRWPDYKVFM